MVPTRLELWRQPVTFTVVMGNCIVNLQTYRRGTWSLGVARGYKFRTSVAPNGGGFVAGLRNAPASEAARIERDVLTVWARSGSPAMDLLYSRGKDAMFQGDTTLAIAHLTALTDHAPEFAEGFHARAQAYFAAGLYGPAIDDLETHACLESAAV